MTRVLVIDDDAQLVGVLAAGLADEGKAVHASTAESFREAMELLAATSFDVLLIDRILPDGDGIELAHRALAMNPRAKVVIMTGSATAEARELARRAGASLFLPKPLDITEVRTAVFSLLAAPRDD